MKNQGGQTLIEVLAAFSVAAILVSAIVIIITTALSNTTFSKNQNTVTRYAQEGIEVMRRMRDNDFATFDALENNTYCLDKGSSVPESRSLGCEQNIDDIYSREVKIEKGNDECGGGGSTKVTVAVLWSDSKCSGNVLCHNTTLVSCLSDFNNVVSTP